MAFSLLASVGGAGVGRGDRCSFAFCAHPDASRSGLTQGTELRVGAAGGRWEFTLVSDHQGAERRPRRAQRTYPQDVWGQDGPAIWAKVCILPRAHTDRKTHFPLSGNCSFCGENGKKPHVRSETLIAIPVNSFFWKERLVSMRVHPHGRCYFSSLTRFQMPLNSGRQGVPSSS